MPFKKAEFVKSAPSLDVCPDPYFPEVCFAGRSNVGKSSLINALVNHKGLAYTSNVPGKTQQINYYLVDDNMYLVDLPGFGYAQVSKKERERWGRDIRDYLLEEGRTEMERETRWLAVTVSNLSGGDDFEQRLRDAAQVSGYKIALYDSAAALVDAYPENDTSFVPALKLPAGIIESLEARGGLPLMPRNSESEVLDSYIALPQAAAPLRYLQAGQLKDEIYEPIKTIRWIIYYGMFISIGLIILVSIWMSRYLTKPITQIKNAARDIADGDVGRDINIERGDELPRMHS